MFTIVDFCLNLFYDTGVHLFKSLHIVRDGYCPGRLFWGATT